MEKVASATSVPIVSPLSVYEGIVNCKTPVSILAVNGQCVANVEKMLLNKNPDLQIFAVSLSPVIQAIESKMAPKEIIDFYDLLSLLETLFRAGCYDVVLACTHFSYIWDELQEVVSTSGLLLNLIPTFDELLDEE